MTVQELVATVLENIRIHWYTDAAGHLRAHEYKRDERQLIRAIATYGHECNQRGWPFQADFIYRDLMKLLLTIRTSGAEVHYLPVYLTGAIRRHLGQRAEELSVAAKSLPTHANNVLAALSNLKSPISNSSGASVPASRLPSDVEVFTQLYRGIGQIQRARKHSADRAALPRRPNIQKELL